MSRTYRKNLSLSELARSASLIVIGRYAKTEIRSPHPPEDDFRIFEMLKNDSPIEPGADLAVRPDAQQEPAELHQEGIRMSTLVETYPSTLTFDSIKRSGLNRP